MRVGPVYIRHEKYVEQEGREHARLLKALFHSEAPRAHPVVEPHACSHAIMKMTNNPDNILWYAETGVYFLTEGLVNKVVVRFGKVDQSYMPNSFLLRQFL